MSHYEERLARDLEAIHVRIGNMAEHVQTALKDAMQSLLTGDRELANMTVLKDNRINRQCRDIDRACHAFIARHLPGAGHLRLISAVIRTNVALERVGDYAVTISRESLQLSEPPKSGLARELDRVSDESRRLLDQSIGAFQDQNADAAGAMIPMVEYIETMMDDIYAELIERSTDRTAREIVAAFVVFSLLKRIADQAKNICEQTQFSVAGKRKATKRFRLLFIDRDNAVRSQMARGIARKTHLINAHFDGAGVDPADAPDAGVIAFLDARGVDMEDAGTKALSSVMHDLNEYDVVISLDGPVREHLPKIPFHTAALTWDVDGALGDDAIGGGEAALEAMYRFLKGQIDELLELLAGPEGS